MIALAALLLGIVFLGYAFYLYRRGLQVESWPKADATITHVSIKLTAVSGRGRLAGDDEIRAEYYLPVVEYTYAVGSRTHKGSRIVAGELHPMLHERALEMVGPYKEGMKIRVAHDPANPGYAVLQGGADGGALTIYVACGIGLLLFAGWAQFAIR